MKLLFFDFETTGLDHRIHAPHELSIILEYGDKLIKKSFFFRPFKGALFTQKALEIGCVTIEQLKGYEKESNVFKELVSFLDEHIEKWNKQDKAMLIGFKNASFDDFWMRELFERNHNKFFGSYFRNATIDCSALAANHLRKRMHKMKNFKLVTVAKELGIKVDENKLHKADYDTELTRFIYRKINNL